MSDSLKDQLIALGLAKNKPRPKRGNRSTAKKRKSGGEISLEEAWNKKSRSEKQVAEEQRRKKREDDLRRRQVNAQIQPIVQENKLNDPAAELKRNFMYKGRIRSVLVTPDQLKALNAGELGLVFLRGSYFVVEPAVLEQVRAISAEHVPDLSGEASQDEGEHPVPDDLIW